MEVYLARLKSVLKTIYNSDAFEDDNKLYDSLLEKKCQNDFNYTYKDLIYAFCLYIYNNTASLQTLTKHKLPFEIKKDEGPNTFFDKLKQYNKYSFQGIDPDDNYYKMLFRCIGNRGKIYDGSNWLQISKDSLESTNNQSLPSTYKIYLPIANESLHLFISKFFPLCKGRNIDYDFKINNNADISRSDNVVIYANDSNIKDYVDVIELVLKIEPNIKVNYEQLHVLAYPYNDHIAIAPNIDYGGKSFSQIICIQICNIRKTSANFDEFYSKVAALMMDYFNNFNVQFSQTSVGESDIKKL